MQTSYKYITPLLSLIILTTTFGKAQTILTGTVNEGTGTFEYESKAVYNGQWKNYKRNGNGTITYPRKIDESNLGSGPDSTLMPAELIMIINDVNQKLKVWDNPVFLYQQAEVETYKEDLGIKMDYFYSSYASNFGKQLHATMDAADKVAAWYRKNDQSLKTNAETIKASQDAAAGIRGQAFQYHEKAYDFIGQFHFSDERKQFYYFQADLLYLKACINEDQIEGRQPLQDFTKRMMTASQNTNSAETLNEEANAIYYKACEVLAKDMVKMGEEVIKAMVPAGGNVIDALEFMRGENLSGDKVDRVQKFVDLFTSFSKDEIGSFISKTPGLGTVINEINTGLSQLSRQQYLKFIKYYNIPHSRMVTMRENLLTVGDEIYKHYIETPYIKPLEDDTKRKMTKKLKEKIS